MKIWLVKKCIPDYFKMVVKFKKIFTTGLFWNFPEDLPVLRNFSHAFRPLKVQKRINSEYFKAQKLIKPYKNV